MADSICVVAPYRELADIAREVGDECGRRLGIEVANLEDAPTLLPRLEGEGYQVLISRGRTAELLRQHTTLPVISIKTSSFDVLRVLADLVHTPTRVGIIGHVSVVRDCKKIAEMLGIDAESILFGETATADYGVLRAQVQQKLARRPVDVLIGDTISECYFKDLCGEFRLIVSGREAVHEAVDNAQAVLGVLEKERVSSTYLSTVLDMFEKAVFSLDVAGRITHANQAACRFFRTERAAMIGLPIEAIDPALVIAHDALVAGNVEVGQVVETREGRMFCYQYPITSGGAVQGLVFALDQVDRLYNLEQKVRHQEQNGKFVARHRLADYTTRDPEMKARLDLLEGYARTDATILMIGESGTGKEWLAQGIHNASRRADGPFVAVNCGALPPTLLESELFGYVDGAFTGASRKGKKGLFELGHKGTVFLDEIGELDKALQTRLLRVIQERQVMRLGSEMVNSVDIRIIAATNQNLVQMVADGAFREDLYYRLNVLKFEPLPLRARRQDIIPIAQAMLREYGRHYQRRIVDFDDDLRRFLLGYDWPGNLRQLSNVMERIAITAPEPVARLAAVNAVLGDLRQTCTTLVGCERCELIEGSLQAIRLKVVLKVVAEERNCKTRAARRLGVDRTTLNRWLKDAAPAPLARTRLLAADAERPIRCSRT